MNTVVRAALAMTHKPGAYAVLAGAGLSAGSGVPQAWEVQRDLILQVAAGLNEFPSDPFAWWHEQHGREATYDDVLGTLAATAAERRALLEPFFKPDADDREAGRKVPSAAHRALAQLVLDGRVRVVITTNFDLLLEAALSDLGVAPVVISSPAQLKGMEPLHAQSAVVVHVHGTYLDPGLLNTSEELRAYPAALNQLLDRAFDEYGLLVLGWSARWDTALREALTRCTTRRYSTWWVDAFPLSPQAGELARTRDADVVIADAGGWLQQLVQTCEALDADRLADPLTLTVAVRTAKRDLGSGRPPIALHDAIREQVELVRALPVLDRSQNMYPASEQAEHARRLAVLEAQIDPLLGLVATAAHWGTPTSDRFWLDDIPRFAQNPRLSGHMDVIELLRAPAMLIAYAAGVASAAAHRDDLVATLVTSLHVPDPYDPERTPVPVTELLGPDIAYPHTDWASEHLQERLRPVLATALGLGDAAFDAAWQRWQYLLAVARYDPHNKRRGGWTGRPRLLVDGARPAPYRVVIAASVRGPVEAAGESHPLLRGGMCGGDLGRFTEGADAFEAAYGNWASALVWESSGPMLGVLPSGPHWPGDRAEYRT